MYCPKTFGGFMTARYDVSMSLTKQDLAAIEKLIKTFSNTLEDRLTARVDDLDDTLSMQTENGLQEVRDQVSAVKEVVDRIDRVQHTELERSDRQETAISQIRKSLRAV
jgi:hypothetical protein